MMTYIENLNKRIKYIKSLCEIAAEGEIYKIRKFWIPGFFNQRNFLTTILQEASRKKGMPIEQFQINYRIMEDNEKEYSSRKAAGLGCYYIHGLYLYGASYNTERETLEDLHRKSAIGWEMPMFHLMVEHIEAVSESPRNKEEIRNDADETLTSARKSKYPETHYLCPLFVNFKKNRVMNNQMAEGQVITYVPIPVKDRHPKFWIKRNICLLCYTEATDLS